MSPKQRNRNVNFKHKHDHNSTEDHAFLSWLGMDPPIPIQDLKGPYNNLPKPTLVYFGSSWLV